MIKLTALIGSRGYGTNDANSDYDYYGAYVEPLEELFGINDSKTERVQENNVDSTHVPLKRFVSLCQKGAYQAIEALHSPTLTVDHTALGVLVRQKSHFVSKAYYKNVMGAAENMAKFGETNTKAFCPILRQYFYLKHYLDHGDFTIRCSADEVEKLLDYKYNYPVVPQKEALKLVADLRKLSIAEFPFQPSDDFVNKLLISIYKNIYFTEKIVENKKPTIEELKKEIRAIRRREKFEASIVDRLKEPMTAYHAQQLNVVVDSLKKAKKVFLEPEVVWSAISAVKKDSSISFERAFEIALKEWGIE